MPPASRASSSVLRSGDARPLRLSDRASGILIIALVPALIWMGLIAAGAWLLGASIPIYALVLCGIGIALFLAAVGAAVTMRE
jgi:hypothetical protein